MEYIKKEELIIGEIYKSTLYNHIFKYLDKNGDKNPNLRKTYNIFNKDFATIGQGLNNITNATSKEKHWLNTCIEQDKFITFEEAMKTFIPEYVELLNNGCRINNNISSGKIYKCSKDVTKTYHYGFLLDNKHRIGFNENEFDRYLKPSTKEAYDAQFIEKDKFVLPEKWCVKVVDNDSNNVEIYKWRNLNWKGSGYINSIKIWSEEINNNYTEITFEQFKKYVLKEEIVVEEVIEPLPQFKIIESIETITKVENNEGNQFFIGDVVKTEDGLHFKIIGFKYDENKTKILAIATDNYPEVVKDINDIEHYIEPKVAEPTFVLPEKWYVKPTNENFNIIKSWSMQKSNIDYTSYINYDYVSFNYLGQYRCKRDCVEITFDQFKKYVLKEQVKNETLLDKAKRLYPIGTKFRVACNPKYIGTVKDHKDYPFQDIDIVNLNTIENIDGCTGMTVFYKGKWAEIINE